MGEINIKERLFQKFFTNFKILSWSPLFLKTTGISPLLGLAHCNLSLWYRNWVERTSHKSIWSPWASATGWTFSKAWVDQQKQNLGSERSICQFCEQKFVPFLIGNERRYWWKELESLGQIIFSLKTTCQSPFLKWDEVEVLRIKSFTQSQSPDNWFNWEDEFLHPQGTSRSLILKLSILPSPKVTTTPVFSVLWLAAKSTSHHSWTSEMSHLLFQSITHSLDPISRLSLAPPNSPVIPAWSIANTSHLVSLLSSCSLLHAATGTD